MVGEILRIRYEITQELYEHPLFYCYIARDRVVGRNVCVRALKAKLGHEKPFVDKLQRLAQNTRNFRHPNVENLYEVSDHEGTIFVISELSKGQLLSQRIENRGSLSPYVSLEIALNICDGLYALHEAGIVHGDVSAYNVMITSENHVRLLLPGLWETLSWSTQASFKMFPVMVAHLAPEIHQGHEPNAFIDLYSLGVLLFQMLTGKLPYSGDTPESIVEKHLSAPIPSSQMHNQAIPAVLDQMIKKLLAKSPEDRYPNIKSLLFDIKKLRDALKFGKPVTLMHKDFAQSNPKLVAPRMEALQQDNKKIREKVSKSIESFDKIPRWMSSLIYLAVVSLFVMAGSWLFFSFSKPKLIVVPDLIGMKLNDANKQAESNKLEIKVSKREPNEQYPEGIVIDINPSPGQQARENSYLYATVSAGSKFVTMPNLRGLTVSEAKSILTSLNLDVEEPMHKVRSDTMPEGKIIGHIPEYKRKIERLSHVKIQVSAGPKSGSSRSALSNETHTYSVRLTMPAGDEKKLVRVDIVDERGTKTIYEQLHYPKDSFDVSSIAYGKDATIKVYFDGDLVKEIYKKASPSESSAHPTAKESLNASVQEDNIN